MLQPGRAEGGKAQPGPLGAAIGWTKCSPRVAGCRQEGATSHSGAPDRELIVIPVDEVN